MRRLYRVRTEAKERRRTGLIHFHIPPTGGRKLSRSLNDSQHLSEKRCPSTAVERSAREDGERRAFMFCLRLAPTNWPTRSAVPLEIYIIGAGPRRHQLLPTPPKNPTKIAATLRPLYIVFFEPSSRLEWMMVWEVDARHMTMVCFSLVFVSVRASCGKAPAVRAPNTEVLTSLLVTKAVSPPLADFA